MKRLFFAVALALPAVAAAAAPPAVRLLMPADRTVLRGGSEATLSWSADSLPAHVEEWEAFLSLDGGRYYAIRITPHLDADIRTFRWRVPNVAAQHARILMRAGDERDERIIELPQSFRIVPRITALDPQGIAVAEAEAGEAALPNGPPVVEWVSGDRHGSAITQHRQREEPLLAAQSKPESVTAFDATYDSWTSLRRPRTVVAANLPNITIAPDGNSQAPVRPLLLLTTRLNI